MDSYPKIDFPYPIKRFGSEYGGYWILDKPYERVYDFGVGEDISFITSLDQTGRCYESYIFDPTLKSKHYIDNHGGFWSTNIVFRNIGISDKDGFEYFYPPKDPTHVSYSVENIQNTNNPIRLQCYRLKTIMDILGHDTIDLLKLDIEGSEYAVIQDMLLCGIFPQTLVVEFHTNYATKVDGKTPYWKNDRKLDAISRLSPYYDTIHIENNNYTFEKRND